MNHDLSSLARSVLVFPEQTEPLWVATCTCGMECIGPTFGRAVTALETHAENCARLEVVGEEAQEWLADQ